MAVYGFPFPVPGSGKFLSGLTNLKRSPKLQASSVASGTSGIVWTHAELAGKTLGGAAAAGTVLYGVYDTLHRVKNVEEKIKEKLTSQVNELSALSNKVDSMATTVSDLSTKMTENFGKLELKFTNELKAVSDKFLAKHASFEKWQTIVTTVSIVVSIEAGIGLAIFLCIKGSGKGSAKGG